MGTYVKASSESAADAGDRANDALRIDGREIRAKVVGEGANLGVTQRARIEYALGGGRINTDAIDNSAGVDTSDHEVNLKILLNAAVIAGDLTLKQRNQVLRERTDDVAGHVLRDNYLQGLALSLAEAQAAERLDAEARLMHAMEKAGKLDRTVEFLPDDSVVAQRRAQERGLVRPEHAVLMAYVKNTLAHELTATDLPDDPHPKEDLFAYFPPALVERFRPQIEATPLSRHWASALARPYQPRRRLNTPAGWRLGGKSAFPWRSRSALPSSTSWSQPSISSSSRSQCEPMSPSSAAGSSRSARASAWISCAWPRASSRLTPPGASLRSAP